MFAKAPPTTAMEASAGSSNTSICDGASMGSGADEELLASLGRKPQLKRNQTFWTLMAYQTTILCSWACNIVMYEYVFTLGGPMSLVWGTIVVAIGQTIVMASMAELCGIWPTAGGQQFYTQLVAPKEWRRFLSYLVGWCVIVGELSTSSGCALNSAAILQSFVEITHPDFAWKAWMTWLVYAAFLVPPTLANFLPAILPGLSFSGAAFNIASGIVWAVVFLAMAPKQSADFVFTEFINNSGWGSNGWVFILSLYVPIYGLYGTDGVMHMVEEMKNASRDGPRVMIWSMVFASVTAFLSAILMCFTVGPDWELYMEASQPYLAWFMSVMKSVYGGGVFCAIIMMGLNFFIIVNITTASSRLIWTMAQDRAFPFSTYLSALNKTLQIPLRAMMTFTVASLLLGLLVLGSDLAFYAIVSGAGVALQISYCIPIICVLIRGRHILPERPHFDLGRVGGYVINGASVAWSVITVLFYVFPQYLPVIGNVEYMNWSIAILGGVFLFVGVYWGVRGRKEYLVESNTVLEQSVVVGGNGAVVSGREVAEAYQKGQ